MNLVSFSGGGFKLVQHLAAYKAVAEHYPLHELHNGAFIGVSAGAIAAKVCAYHDHNEPDVLELAMSENLPKVVFGKWWNRPITRKGKLSTAAIARIIAGKDSLGNHSELLKHLARIDAKNKPWNHSAKCVAVAVNASTGERGIYYTQRDNYAILASCAIPVVMPPINVHGYPHFDGGLRDHSPAATWLDSEMPKPKRIIEIYTRPEKVNQFLTSYKPGIFRHLSRAIDIATTEISYNDQRLVKERCERDGIELVQLFCPRVLNGTFDADPKRLKQAYSATYHEIKEQLNNQPTP
jgi:predicted acylesterase/phospholipase RssA